MPPKREPSGSKFTIGRFDLRPYRTIAKRLHQWLKLTVGDGGDGDGRNVVKCSKKRQL